VVAPLARPSLASLAPLAVVSDLTEFKRRDC
jgi:hypothetical protein